jgi:hypothetical protein
MPREHAFAAKVTPSYNRGMARGWESKSVEAQIEESVANDATKKRAVLTPEELQKQRRKMDLELSRSRVMQQLEQSTDERYSELLRRTLAALDKEIAEL